MTLPNSWFWRRVALRGRWLAGGLLMGAALSLGSCATHEQPQSGQLKDVVKVAAGWGHSCTVNGKGHVKCWGSNKYGQLGDGTHTGKRAPVDVSGLMMGTKDVTVGERHTCAVTVAGGLKCWGSNHDFQLGDGTRQDRVTPVDVADLKNEVRTAAAGEQHTCVLTSGGGVKCWGNNHDGQLGDGTTADKSNPVDVEGLMNGITAITAGWNHTCALTSSGAAKCWGNNQDGQLGDGTTVARSSPTEVTGLGGGVTALAAGGRHTCALIETGALKCWGQNQRGQLGDGTTADRVVPVNVAELSTGVMALAAGWQHSCALMLNGAIKCWGNNGNGQVGAGNLLLKVTATDVPRISAPAVAVTAGREHTCALLADNAVRCWGDDQQGQLGKDTKVSQRHF